MLMLACVCSGVSILKWQERSECSCQHPPVPAGAFCSGRSIHGGTSILNAPAGMRLFWREHSEMAGAF